MTDLLITGIGMTSAVGANVQQVRDALLAGRSRFDVMHRPGRQREGTAYLGAEIAEIELPPELDERRRRTISWAAQVALATAAQAWRDARLAEIDPRRVGLIVGGSNLQQRELVNVHDSFRDRFDYLRPNYAQVFMDSDICATCSEFLGIAGVTYTVGGASASGHLAIVEAAQLVRHGRVDACIAVGAPMDLSYWECQAFRASGAMGSDRFAHAPAAACRPFDELHDGFIYGENCGAVVVESRQRSGVSAHASLRGWSFLCDGHRGPEPLLDGEVRAIHAALQMAGITSREIDYVNPHGTGSVLGDAVELQALRSCGLDHAFLNATKSIIGHGLTAAGTVEIVATLLQMQAGVLHPTANLSQPVDPDFNWVMGEPRAHAIANAVNLSFGFGGLNSAICISRGSR